ETSVPIVNESIRSPGAHVTSFLLEPESPAGPQIASRWIDVGVMRRRSVPWWNARYADHDGGGQPPSHRQVPSSSSVAPPMPTVTCTTPLCAFVRSKSWLCPFRLSTYLLCEAPSPSRMLLSVASPG